MKYTFEFERSIGKEKGHCLECPIKDDDDCCRLQTNKDFGTWTEQLENCPLQEVKE
jgi:hypothetical protein